MVGVHSAKVKPKHDDPNAENIVVSDLGFFVDLDLDEEHKHESPNDLA